MVATIWAMKHYEEYWVKFAVISNNVEFKFYALEAKFNTLLKKEFAEKILVRSAEFEERSVLWSYRLYFTSTYFISILGELSDNSCILHISDPAS